MKRIITTRCSLITGIIVAAFGMTIVPAAAVATRPGVTAPAPTVSSAANDAKSQAKLKLIISRGNKEIERRLQTLNTLSVKINSAQKLSSNNKTMLSNEVKDEISGLKDLKTKLVSDTDLATAQADAQTIFSGYRVYALIVPKMQLVKTADDQQVTEAKLADLSIKLQFRVNDAQKKGKDTASLQATLDGMTAKTKAAQTLSSNVESDVINLQPSDYNNNRGILSSNRDKLKAAQNDIKSAAADARTIVAGLKKL